MRENTYVELVGVFKSVLVYVQQNLDEPLDIEQLAKVAGFSPFHFQRSFQRFVGEAAIVHVRRIRMERAAHQLRHTQASISSIADDAGFSGLAGFSRAFSEAFSVPPSEYREMAWDQYWQPSPSGVHYHPNAELQFRPLPFPGTPSTARVDLLSSFRVLAMSHDEPRNHEKTWARLFQWLAAHEIDYKDYPLVSFTLSPRRPSQGWKVRAHVSIVTEREVPENDQVRPYRIGGGHYLIKRYLGNPVHLGDAWARMWQEDRPALRVRQRQAIAYMHLINATETASPDEYSIDLFMPIHPPG